MSDVSRDERAVWAEAVLAPLLAAAEQRVQWSTERRLKVPAGHAGELAALKRAVEAIRTAAQ